MPRIIASIIAYITSKAYVDNIAFTLFATQIMRTPTSRSQPRPLKGCRIVSLALNLPGPAALMRCRELGARCFKLEPPLNASGNSSDPMFLYNQQGYAQMHEGISMLYADLKTEAGQKILRKALSKANILVTSFRPTALKKLGLHWPTLHREYPQLAMVAIFGASGDRAEEPGHDLTYQAEHDLVSGTSLPATLYADMGGSLMASEAILQARLEQLQRGRSVRLEVALNDAAGYLGLPRSWGMTGPGTAVGGGHAGYRVYPCKDGRVALAALEPHFAARLARAANLPDGSLEAMYDPSTRTAVAKWVAKKTRAELDAMSTDQDIPLLTLAPD